MASIRWRKPRYYVRYTDADGVRHETEGYTDRRVAEQRAREIEREVERVRAGLIDPAELVFRRHASRHLGSHLDDYHAHLIAKGSTVKHADLATYRARRVIEMAQVARLSDLTPSRVQWALKAVLEEPSPQRSGQGARPMGKPSLATVNHYRTAIRAFSRWLWKDGRIGSDPLVGVTGFNAKEDRRHDRRTLGVDELRRLIEAAHSGPPWRKMTGPMRAMCYRLAVGTGLRYSEIASITPESFDWSGNPATVTVAAGYTKNGEPATLPLPSDLADDLYAYVATLPSGSPVFPLAPVCGAKMLRPDLERAGIPYVDAGGLVFDFHALRCQCATLADAAGVTPRVVQKLMRHSTLELTGRYTRPRAVDIEAAASMLPTLKPETDRPEPLAATGTDDNVMSQLSPILPTLGVVLGPNLSHPDVMAGSDEPTMMKRLTPENTAQDASCRGDSHRVLKYRGGDSNPRPADYETAALTN